MGGIWLVLVSCGYVPLEIPLALGMPAKRAVFWGPGPSCEAYLPRDFCSYAKAFVREYLQDERIAVAGSCDAMRRACDVLRYFGLAREVHFVDVPRACGGGADAYYAEVLREFAQGLAGTSGREPGGAGRLVDSVDGPSFQRRLLAVTRSMNRIRSGLLRVFELQAAGHMSVVDAMCLTLEVNDALGGELKGDLENPRIVAQPDGGSGPGDGDEAATALAIAADVLESATHRVDATGDGRAGDQCVRVGVSGTCLLEPALLGVLESAGLTVAFVDSCLGSRSFGLEVPVDARSHETENGADGADGVGACADADGPGGARPDPFRMLARAYLSKPACPRMFVGDARARRLRALARSSGAQGIVYFAPKFCDHAYYDFAELKGQVSEGEALPMLLLEGEYGSAGSGQTLTRVTAFREMLEGRLGLG